MQILQCRKARIQYRNRFVRNDSVAAVACRFRRQAAACIPAAK